LDYYSITGRVYAVRVAQQGLKFYGFYTGNDLLKLPKSISSPISQVTILYTPYFRYLKTKRNIMLRLEKVFFA
jgi:hypothetical protein